MKNERGRNLDGLNKAPNRIWSFEIKSLRSMSQIKILYQNCQLLNSELLSFLSRRSTAGSSGLHGLNGSTQWQISQFATTIRPSRYPSEATTRGGGHYSMASMSAGEATWQGIHHQLTSPKQKLKTCHRHSRRRSLGSVIKTKRSRSCVNQLTVPTVTVWDEDDMKMTKTDEDAV